MDLIQVESDLIQDGPDLIQNGPDLIQNGPDLIQDGFASIQDGSNLAWTVLRQAEYLSLLIEAWGQGHAEWDKSIIDFNQDIF